ncbi:MAG: ECF transporter S component [Candidatus Promineifilaceae bacterium]|nr:ECF transporter S component [Candidatus Promineifilaceae bacterium]
MKRIAIISIYVLSALVGIAAFIYPFLLPGLQPADPLSDPTASSLRLTDAPLLTSLLVMISMGALLVEIHGQAVNAKVVAALGVLVAVASVLRFIETAIPGPGGFSPIFVPIILAGYVFGPRFGFLMGVLTLLASALLTAGIGPWLPYQMLVSGWVGMSAGWLPRPQRERLELFMLVGFAILWGLSFGFVINLYFWPFVAGDMATAWEPGLSIMDGLKRYGAFYLATSVLWDLVRAVGNAVLIVAVGIPTVRALERFRRRFEFELV